MSNLRLIRPNDQPPSGPPPRSRLRHLRGTLVVLGVSCAFVLGCVLLWWTSMADTRAIRALPDAQRIPLYERTLDNLRTICDPAAARSMRDFCHEQADLALKFRECDSDPTCQELARRHLPQPRR